MKRKILAVILVIGIFGSIFSMSQFSLTASAMAPNNSKIVKVQGTLVLTSDGVLWGWGDNAYGQLLDGTTKTRNYALKLMSGVSDFSSKTGQTIHVLKKDGTVWGWGKNQGYVGNGGKTTVKKPVKILSGVKELASDYLVLKKDNTYWCWYGNGHHFEPTESYAPEPVGFPYDSDTNCYSQFYTVDKNGDLRVKVILDLGDDDETLEEYGSSARWLDKKIVSNVKSYAFSGGFNAAVDHNGNAWVWRLRDLIKGAPIKKLENVKEVQVNFSYVFFLKKDDTLWGIGRYGSNFLGENGEIVDTPIQITDNVRSFELRYTNFFAIKKDNTVWGNGVCYAELGDEVDGRFFETSVLTKIADKVSEVFVPKYGGDIYFLKTDKSLWAWGAYEVYSGNKFSKYMTFKPFKVMNNVTSVFYRYPNANEYGTAAMLVSKTDQSHWGWNKFTGTASKMNPVKITRYLCNPESVSLNKNSLSMNPGTSATLKATITPGNANDLTVTWSSSNPKIASVSKKGVVTAQKAGTATITAKTVNGKKATCTIKTTHNYVTMRVNRTRAIQNGNKTTIDRTGAKPTIISGRTMVPIRFVGEKLGGKVSYVNAKKPITITYADKKVQVSIGGKTMQVYSGNKVKNIRLDVAAQKRNGRVLIPVRAIGEALGFRVYYQDNTRLIVISSTPLPKDLRTSYLKAGRAYITR